MRDPEKSKELPVVSFKTASDGRMVITEMDDEKFVGQKTAGTGHASKIRYATLSSLVVHPIVVFSIV